MIGKIRSVGLVPDVVVARCYTAVSRFFYIDLISDGICLAVYGIIQCIRGGSLHVINGERVFGRAVSPQVSSSCHGICRCGRERHVVAFFHDHHVLIRITSAVDDDVRACSLYIDTEDGFLPTSALVGMDDGNGT